jgi:GxxExxY protein
MELKHGELTDRIIHTYYEVYNEVGCGFLEKVYENALAVALRQAGLRPEQQVPLAVHFRGEVVGDYSADLVVNGLVVLEVKAARTMDPIFEAQLLNYLRATDMEVGLLLSFGPKVGFRRLVFDNSRKLRR